MTQEPEVGAPHEHQPTMGIMEGHYICAKCNETLLFEEPAISFVGEQFARNMERLCFIAAADSEKKGFTDHISNELYVPTKLGLVVTEVAEAIEAHRCGNPPDEHLPAFKALTIEMADAVIRLMTLAYELGIPLGEAVSAKMAFNRSRPVRHGGKLY